MCSYVSFSHDCYITPPPVKQLMNEYVMYFLGQCTWRPERVTVAFGGKGNVDGTGDDGLVGGAVGASVHSSR